MQDSPAPQTHNPYKKWFFVLTIIVVLLLAAGVYVFILVQEHIDQIEGDSTVNTYFDTTDDPMKGNPDAKIVIVEFADFQCPFCFQAFPVMRELMDTYQDDVKFVYRDFPITDSHPQAEKAAEAGECAQAQDRFWEMHDKMFLNQADLTVPALKEYAEEIGLDTDLFDQCLDSGTFETEVAQDFSDGIAAGVTGTPTFFINGRPFTGTISYDSLAQIIEQLIDLQSQ